MRCKKWFADGLWENGLPFVGREEKPDPFSPCLSLSISLFPFAGMVAAMITGVPCWNTDGRAEMDSPEPLVPSWSHKLHQPGGPV
jgi:hypothetical protein